MGWRKDPRHRYHQLSLPREHCQRNRQGSQGFRQKWRTQRSPSHRLRAFKRQEVGRPVRNFNSRPRKDYQRTHSTVLHWRPKTTNDLRPRLHFWYRLHPQRNPQVQHFLLRWKKGRRNNLISPHLGNLTSSRRIPETQTQNWNRLWPISSQRFPNFIDCRRKVRHALHRHQVRFPSHLWTHHQPTNLQNQNFKSSHFCCCQKLHQWWPFGN